MPLGVSDAAARTWAVLFARLILGLIFFMAGFWKVFELGPVGHVRRFFLPFQHTFLPTLSLWVVGFTIPFIELIAGGLVILGFQTRYASIALGIVLVTVTFGHLLEQPLYAFHEHVIPRLALLLFVMFMPQDVDRFSLDHVWAIRRASTQRGPTAS